MGKARSSPNFIRDAVQMEMMKRDLIGMGAYFFFSMYVPLGGETKDPWEFTIVDFRGSDFLGSGDTEVEAMRKAYLSVCKMAGVKPEGGQGQ